MSWLSLCSTGVVVITEKAMELGIRRFPSGAAPVPRGAAVGAGAQGVASPVVAVPGCVEGNLTRLREGASKRAKSTDEMVSETGD
jgi:hypothetical protein